MLSSRTQTGTNMMEIAMWNEGRRVGRVERDPRAKDAQSRVGLVPLDPPYASLRSGRFVEACLALAAALVLTGGPAANGQEAEQQGEQEMNIAGPRELLRMYGIDREQFDKSVDGQPTSKDENTLLLKLLFRLRDFRPIDIERWAHPVLDPAELVKDPDPARGEFFHLVGRVSAIEALELTGERADRFEMKTYYRCEFILEKDQSTAVVFAQTIPDAWQAGAEVDQRASAWGMFLKISDEAAGSRRPIFAAGRIAWHPATPLGELGMDVGLLDDLTDRRHLGAEEREAFYQMLAATGRAKPGQLHREAQEVLREAGKQYKRKEGGGFSVVPLFNRAKQQRGRLFELTGTARRVLRIRVDNPEIVSRFGIDHYYEMAVYTDDSQDNPIIFCVRRLPKGMPTGDDARYGEYVRVAGFFFKTWGYGAQRPVELPEAQKKNVVQRQLAPLLIGREPHWYRQEPPARSTMAGAIGGLLFVLVLLGIWLALWRYSRGDRRFRDETMAKALAPEPGEPVSLDDIGLRADGTPDFSRLEERADEDRGAE